MFTMKMLLAFVAMFFSLWNAKSEKFDKGGSADPGPCDEKCMAKLPAIGTIEKGYLTSIENSVLGTLYNDIDPSEAYAACHETMMCHTMLNLATLTNFGEAVQYVVTNKIKGDIMELGVWRGGGVMHAKAVLNVYEPGSQRDVLLFDVFETMSLYSSNPKWDKIFGKNPLNSVKAISNGFNKLGLLDSHVKFHVGLFDVTTKKFRKEAPINTSIALLRVDGNKYFSYQDAMYNLYDLVPVGGIVIFDDVFDHPPVAEFWKHFCKDYNMHEKMNRVIGTGRGRGTGWFIKEKQIVLDRSKMRTDQEEKRQGIFFKNLF